MTDIQDSQAMSWNQDVDVMSWNQDVDVMSWGPNAMVDIDDVIVPWFETVDRACVEAWGPSDRVRGWEMWRAWPGKTREDWTDVVQMATRDYGLYTTVEPIPGAVEAISDLREAGYRVHLVTARGFMENGSQIRDWTRSYVKRFDIEHDNLIFAKDKVAVQAEIGIRWDWAIDDGPHNYEALRRASLFAWLCDAPHNLDYPASFSVPSLREFANRLISDWGRP